VSAPEPTPLEARSAAPPRRRASPAQRILPWAITLACFAYLWLRIDGAAARQGKDAATLLAGVFAQVRWTTWLALMVPYSLCFFLVDSLVLWRVINWFNARVSYLDILPVRASTYILSILNEQIGKGAMAVYLHRREGVPGWQVGSSMLFIMFCEFYYLLAWATIGVSLRGSELPREFQVVPWIAAGALVFFAAWIAYFRGAIAPGSKLRERDLLHAFRNAAPWQYLTILLLRSPALLIGVAVYTVALRMFGIEMELGAMLSYVPLVFFGAAVPGPMRSVAIVLWVTLLPDHAAEAAVFGLVMHNFFIFFNAAIGLLFLRRAQHEIFGTA
jgi:hypothetical protein